MTAGGEKKYVLLSCRMKEENENESKHSRLQKHFQHACHRNSSSEQLCTVFSSQSNCYKLLNITIKFIFSNDLLRETSSIWEYLSNLGVLYC